MCMFNPKKSHNVVDMNGIPLNRSFPVDNVLRFFGRIVHQSVRRVARKAYWWNKVADCR